MLLVHYAIMEDIEEALDGAQANFAKQQVIKHSQKNH